MKGAGGQSPEIVLTVVYDNNPYDEHLQTAGGFGCVIQGLSRAVLFDTGGKGDLLLSTGDRTGSARCGRYLPRSSGP